MEKALKIVREETNIELLKQMFEFTLKKLDEQTKRLEFELRERAKEAQSKFKLEEQLSILKKNFFDRSSEKRKIEDRLRDTEDVDLLVHSYSLVPPVSQKQVKKLQEEIIYHDCTNEDLKEMSESLELKNPSANQWQELEGFYDESQEVTVIERQYKKLIHRRKKYRLKSEYLTPEKMQIITAPGAIKLLPGSTYSIDFAVSSVVDKYVNHIPLERQTRMMESLGLKSMSSKTLYNLCWAVSEHLLPISEKIKKEILFQKTVHADETPWPINNSKDSNGYMWVISNQAGSFYRFEPTRSGKIIEELLEGYVGSVMCDGYTGYNRLKNLEKIELTHCWAHARRKFIEIQDNYPTECEEILKLMDELFYIERKAKSFEELKTLRTAESRPAILKIQKYLNEHLITARSESHFRSAIEYVLKYWSGLTVFLENENVPLTNNEAERTIRHAVMGRKNFHGSRTINGADVAATLYTVIESCKKVEIDPRTYILSAVKDIAAGKDFLTPLELAKKERSQ